MMAACSSSFAQINPPKNELGLNLYGLEIDVDYLGDGLQQPYYMNGLQYKRLINQHYKWRVSGQYHTRHEEGSVNVDPMQFSTSWNYITTTYEVRSGAERSFFASSKLTPFVFADIVYRKTNDKGSGSSSGGDFPPYGGSYEINRTTNFAGGMIGFGIKYSPVPSVYIGAETSISKYWKIFSGQQNSYSVGYFSPIKTLVFGVNF
jgi:hypothetical protein